MAIAVSPLIVQRSGEALAASRRLYGISARLVGEAMGVSRQRITAIESLQRVTPAIEKRYERALREALQARAARVITRSHHR
jgi:transcriptional regulator with XRE-family HTH domain